MSASESDHNPPAAYCSRCGSPVAPAAKFCQRCGTAVAAPPPARIATHRQHAAQYDRPSSTPSLHLSWPSLSL